jgi:hypothetical protein
MQTDVVLFMRTGARDTNLIPNVNTLQVVPEHLKIYYPLDRDTPPTLPSLTVDLCHFTSHP